MLEETILDALLVRSSNLSREGRRRILTNLVLPVTRMGSNLLQNRYYVAELLMANLLLPN